MSATYAERLSEYPNKGICGLPESYESKRSFHKKIDELAKLIRQSRHTVVLTGAGISTSAGIPDFRGPNGIWTKENERKKLEKRVARRNNIGGVEGGKKSPRKQPSPQGKGETGMSVGTSPSVPQKQKQNNTNMEQESASRNTSNDATAESKSPGENAPNGVTSSTNNQNSISFETAIPTYTHRSLTHLILQPPPPPQPSEDDSDNDKNTSNTNHQSKTRTYLHHIITQNIDGLHGKTKIPRNHLSILHGDIFTEICDTCETEHIRPYEITSIGLKHTGRDCALGGNPPGSCPGKLKDTLLDWEDDLPQKDWARSQEECAKADLILCLGTSLRIEPAGSLCEEAMPVVTLRGPKKRKRQTSKQVGKKLGYVIVNLQVTPKDEGATLLIRAKVDDVMKELMLKLGYTDDWDDKYDYGKSGAVNCTED